MAQRDIAQPTCLTMNLLNELEGLESISKRVLDACTYLESLMKVAFGRKGRAIMIQKQNGQMMITRSGIQILDHVITEKQLCDPIYKILIDCARNIDTDLGDGVKRFISYTCVICRLFSHNSSYINFRDKLNQLADIQNVLKLAELNYVGETNILNDGELEKISESFLSTRLSKPVSKMLTDVFCKWIKKINFLNSSHMVNGNSIDYTQKNLNVFFKIEEYPASVSESFIIEGLLLKGEIIGLPYAREFKCVLIVHYLSESDECNDQNVDYEVIKLLNAKLDKPRALPLMLITNFVLSDPLKYFVRMKNVMSIQGVLEEEAKFLFNHLILYYKDDDCVVNCSRHLNINSLKVSLPNISQLVICSPTIDVGLQLQGCLCNLITLLSYSIRNKILVLGTNSIFLSALYHELSRELASDNSLPPILNHWHDSKSSLNSMTSVRSQKALSVEEESPSSQFVTHTIETISDSKYMDHNSLVLLAKIIYPFINCNDFMNGTDKFSEVISLELPILFRSLSVVINLLSIDRILTSKRKS